MFGSMIKKVLTSVGLIIMDAKLAIYKKVFTHMKTFFMQNTHYQIIKKLFYFYLQL